MTAVLICIGCYFAVPILSILFSGRMLTWQGWLVFVLLWPIA